MSDETPTPGMEAKVPIKQEPEYKVHGKIKRRYGRVLEEFSEGVAVAMENLNRYVELPTLYASSSVGSVRRYARAFNQKGAAIAGHSVTVSVFQAKDETDPSKSKVYIKATPTKKVAEPPF